MKPIFYCQTTSAHQGMISSLQLNPFSSALSVVFKCFMHTMSSLWKPHECYLLFMPSELLLIILWQCLEGLNKIRAISASHCPSRVAASKAGIQYFWARDTNPFHTLVRSKYAWNLLPTSAALVSIGRRVWCVTQPGPQDMWLQITMLVCHNTVVHSSSNVVRNETMPKRENELKDWIMSSCCLWIGKDEAQRDWSPCKVDRRVWNRSHRLTCKTFFFECTDVLLFSLKHLAHNHIAAVRQSYNPGIMTQSFIWDSRAIKSANLWEKDLKHIKCIQFLHLLWERKVGTEKKYFSKFLRK